jgi:WD40 repeat protein
MVSDCTYSPDGSLIASASQDGTLKIWDALTSALVGGPFRHTGFAYGCAFSPDGSRVVGTFDRSMGVWSTATGEEVMRLAGHSEAVVHCVVSADGSMLASAGWESEPQVGTVKLWDFHNGREIKSLVTEQRAVACALNPTGTIVAAAGDLGDLQIWDVEGGQMLQSLSHGWDALFGCAFGPDGELVASASGSDTDTTKLWDTRSSACRWQCTGGQWCDFTPDGSYVATTDADGVLRLFDTAEGDECMTLPLSGPGRVALHPREPKAAAFVGTTHADLYVVEFEGIRY